MKKVWKQINHFNRDEAWGDPDKINAELLFTLDAWRSYIGIPVIILCGTQGQHILDSYHYKGLAVDVMMPSSETNLFDLIFSAMKFPFTGIGVYSHWKYKSRRYGGLHLDVRPASGPFDRKATWIQSFNGDGDKYYEGLNLHTMVRHFIV